MDTSLERSRPPFWWVRWVPLTLLVTGLAVILYLTATPVVVPLALSFALAFMLEPLTEWFERRGMSRILAVLLTIGVALLVIAIVLLVLLPAVWHQLVASAAKFPGLVRATGDRLQDFLGYVETRLNPAAVSKLREALASVQADPGAITTKVEVFLLSGIAGLVSIGSSAIGLLIVPFFVYYLLLDLEKIRRGIDERIPIRHRRASMRLFDDIGNVLRGYVRGRLLVSIGMAIFYTIGLALVGVPVPAAIGIIAGFIGIVPYLGVVTGMVLAIGFAALDGASLAQIVGIVVVFSLAQVLEDYVLTPRLIGDRLELHPLVVFIGLIVAGDLFGLLGLVMAIPVLAVIKVLIHFLDDLYRSSDFFLDEGRHRTPVIAASPNSALPSPVETPERLEPRPAGPGPAMRATRPGKKKRA
jgi:predicted PurR-regulated permease PerM